MGKFKPAKKKKTKAGKPGGAIPCIILLVSGMVLISLLFYAVLKSG